MKSASRLPRAVKDNLVVRELDDETLVYDLDRDEAHCLNYTAALVWEQCDGQTTAKQAAQALQAKLGESVDADLVWLAVKQLQRYRLVEREKNTPGVLRRDLVLKYAPLALALPLIISIPAPTVAQAASCVGLGQDCSVLPCCPGQGFCFGSPPKCGAG